MFSSAAVWPNFSGFCSDTMRLTSSNLPHDNNFCVFVMIAEKWFILERNLSCKSHKTNKVCLTSKRPNERNAIPRNRIGITMEHYLKILVKITNIINYNRPSPYRATKQERFLKYFSFFYWMWPKSTDYFSNELSTEYQIHFYICTNVCKCNMHISPTNKVLNEKEHLCFV